MMEYSKSYPSQSFIRRISTDNHSKTVLGNPEPRAEAKKSSIKNWKKIRLVLLSIHELIAIRKRSLATKTEEVHKLFNKKTLKINDELRKISIASGIDERTINVTTDQQRISNVFIKISYFENQNVLQIAVIQANDVLTEKQKNIFKKVRFHLTVLNVSKRAKYCTSIRDHCDIIFFHEQFVYSPLSKEDLFTTSVRLRLYGKEFLGLDKLLSEETYYLSELDTRNETTYVTLSLKSVDRNLIFPSPSDARVSICSTTEQPCCLIDGKTNDSQIKIGLRYEFPQNLLIVNIFEGSNLKDPCLKVMKPPDTYADVSFKENKNIIRCRTKLIKSDCNPIFHHIFRFEVLSSQLEMSKLLVYVYATITDTQKCLIGFVDISNFLGQLLNHEADMLYKWHTLHLPKSMQYLNESNHK